AGAVGVRRRQDGDDWTCGIEIATGVRSIAPIADINEVAKQRQGCVHPTRKERIVTDELDPAGRSRSPATGADGRVDASADLLFEGIDSIGARVATQLDAPEQQHGQCTREVVAHRHSPIRALRPKVIAGRSNAETPPTSSKEFARRAARG